MTTRNNIIQISQEEWTLKLSKPLKAIRLEREMHWQNMITGLEDSSCQEDAWIELWEQTMDCLQALYGVGSERYEKILDREWDRQIGIYLKLEQQGKILKKITDRTIRLKISHAVH